MLYDSEFHSDAYLVFFKVNAEDELAKLFARASVHVLGKAGG